MSMRRARVGPALTAWKAFRPTLGDDLLFPYTPVNSVNAVNAPLIFPDVIETSSVHTPVNAA
jgi:hypothetical protein